MTRIVVYSNWCYCDRIEGEDRNLVSGDVLALMRPNGVRQVVRIDVEEKLLGSRETVRQTRAFAETIAQGAIVRVALQPTPGLNVERVTPETPITPLGTLL